MENKKIEIGSVVYSTAGRDSGKYYLVFEVINENYVLIADGEKHKVSKPKLKKIKHLKYGGEILSNLAEKIITKKQIFDSEIKRSLKQFNVTDDNQTL